MKRDLYNIAILMRIDDNLCATGVAHASPMGKRKVFEKLSELLKLRTNIKCNNSDESVLMYQYEWFRDHRLPILTMRNGPLSAVRVHSDVIRQCDIAITFEVVRAMLDDFDPYQRKPGPFDRARYSGVMYERLPV
jgi:hypothetical protein